MRRTTFLVVLALLTPLLARADHAATQPGDLDTPKKALKTFDRIGTDPNVDRATFFYHATTDDQRKVAKAFASVDLALAKLRKKVAARFDDAAGDAMVHALRDVTAADIDAATEEVNGDHAVVKGKAFGEPLDMIKVDGTWKIDVGASMKKSNADADTLSDLCDDLVDAIERTEQEIEAGKYANASLLERAMKRRVKAIIGGE